MGAETTLLSALGRRLRLLARRGLPWQARRIPFVQQVTAADCGAACLAMVLELHGKKVELHEIRRLVGTAGTNAAALVEGAGRLGLRGHGVQIDDVDDLGHLPPGAILHWRFTHFVVLERVTRRGFRIVDPSVGRMTVSRREVRRAFTGAALIFEPTADFEESPAGGPGLGHLFKRCLAFRAQLGRVFVTSLLIRILALALPVLTGILVDEVVLRGQRDLLFALAVGVAAIVAFRFLSSLVRGHTLVELRTRIEAGLSSEFVDHLLRLPFAFFQQRTTGDLLMRLNSNASIREILTLGAISGLLDGFLVVLYLILLMLAEPRIGLLVLVLAALRLGVFLLTRGRYRDLMARSLGAQARAQSFQVEMLEGIATLKANGAERPFLDRWWGLFTGVLNASVERGRFQTAVSSTLDALSAASPLLVLLYGCFLVLEGELSLGAALALSALATGFLDPLAKLVETAFQLQLLASYMARVADVLTTAPEQDRRRARPAHRLTGRVSLEAVSFRYDARAPLAVSDVDLEIQAGQFIALVGRSGAGKSTLACLLAGLYLPTSGRILYDGIDLTTLDLRSVRTQLGIVQQEPFLFGSTIRDNIDLTGADLPDERVIEAARRARIDEEILAFPMGYDTVVAGRGGSISGGQRQRLALARALAKRPPLLLLDEATSELDTLTESQILVTLGQLSITRIVIAHRFSTIREADQILVMEAGRIVDRGTHGELMARPGLYRDLVHAQEEKDPPAAQR